MTTKSKAWIGAMRLRTLPLAASSILAGTAIVEQVDWLLFVLTLLTCLSLQVLSNLANDYGDFSKGTDNEKRVGPARAMQSGAIAEPQMRKALVINSVLSLALGLVMLAYVFVHNREVLPLLGLLVLGFGAIAAAIKYTVGKSAYGYKGFGDVFVFLFFGLVGVLGTAVLQRLMHGEEPLRATDIYPAISVGAFACMVLNLNNLRDHVNDKVSGKMTLVVKLGFFGGKLYHVVLWILAVGASCCWLVLADANGLQSVFLFVQLLVGVHLIRVLKETEPARLDSLLKVVALGSFVSSLLMLVLS